MCSHMVFYQFILWKSFKDFSKKLKNTQLLFLCSLKAFAFYKQKLHYMVGHFVKTLLVAQIVFM